jgi:hypothetical protein
VVLVVTDEHETNLYFSSLKLILKAEQEVIAVSYVLAAVFLKFLVVGNFDPNRLSLKLHAKT